MSSSLVQNTFQALAGGDPEQIAAVLTEDAEWLSQPGNATAVALDTTHHMIGRSAIVRFFAEDFPRLFARDVALEVHRLHADDELGVVEATMSATLPDGNRFSNDYCFVIEIRDGLVRRVREYTDTARGLRAVGQGSCTQMRSA